MDLSEQRKWRDAINLSYRDFYVSMPFVDGRYALIKNYRCTKIYPEAWFKTATLPWIAAQLPCLMCAARGSEKELYHLSTEVEEFDIVLCGSCAQETSPDLVLAVYFAS